MWTISFCDTTAPPITVEKIQVTPGGVLEIVDKHSPTQFIIRYIAPCTWADAVWEPNKP